MAFYVHHRSSFEHDTGPHPESPRRLLAIEAAMEERDWLGLERVQAPAAAEDDLLRVHGPAHIERIHHLAEAGGGMIDMDTVASEGSWRAAVHAAGGGIHAIDLLLGPGAPGDGFAFCGMRPPGHHAEADKAMGFCLFNNPAIAARYARAAHDVERILICDWDVHHGNGTEAIFYDQAEVLYSSIHQEPLYPGTGAATDFGRGAGEGYTVNLPVSPGAGPDEFLSLVQQVVMPVARAYEPGLILLSAGYDAHRDDPLAQCELDDAAYGDMAACFRVLGRELGVPVVVLLEGGYSVGALAASVVTTIEGLQGGEARAAPAAFAGPYRERLAAHWPVLAD
ncbi:MAG TPA: histone deacetylase [Solirubrobacterales bacterium]|nr:histone deacetylase [Solirubrobacterales bacterium]